MCEENDNGELDEILKGIEERVNAGDYSDRAEQSSALIAAISQFLVYQLLPQNENVRSGYKGMLAPNRISGASYDAFSQYIRSPAGQAALKILRDEIDSFLGS